MTRLRSSLAFGLVISLVLAACGSDDNTEGASAGSNSDIQCATGSIAGAGSTFAQNIVQQWIKDYSAACPGATINYQGVGSGAGIQQFTAGTVDFAGSDVPLSAAEQTTAEGRHGGVVHAPWSAGGVAIMYNLSGVPELNLSSAALAGIFAGRVTRWDDPLITSTNAGATLPSTPIQVVHRSDGSGTTEAFTSYLTASAPEVWTAGSARDVRWPVGQGARGSDGVTAAVRAGQGTIGYAELSFPKANSLGVAKIRNASGAYVSPDEAGSVTAALNSAVADPSNKVTIDYQPTDTRAYPISTVTYVIAPRTPADPAKAALLKSFINYALNEGQRAATGLAYAEVSPTLLDPAKEAVATIGSPAAG